MGAERWDEQVGSVADEAARLLESLRRSAESAAEPTAEDTTRGAAGAPDDGAPDGGAPDGGGPDEAPPAAGTHDPFCTWCPLCRTAEVVRTLSPETITRLADLASLAATVLADLASARSAAGAGGARAAPADQAPGDSHDPGATRPRRAGASRPIPVRDADDPQEAPRG